MVHNILHKQVSDEELGSLKNFNIELKKKRAPEPQLINHNSKVAVMIASLRLNTEILLANTTIHMLEVALRCLRSPCEERLEKAEKVFYTCNTLDEVDI